ncbi:MAG: hypothetical protein WKH64_19535 [Chloroflexia bacterium]
MLDKLRAVRWEKGPHWVGIAGKMTAGGKFSVGGTKEVGTRCTTLSPMRPTPATTRSAADASRREPARVQNTPGLAQR